jgi:glycosyltransferase involved in cell wall biosynthesis
MAYAGRLAAIYLITHSYRTHRLERLDLAPHVQAIPTDARGRVHSIVRMLTISWSILRRRRIDVIHAQDPVPTGLLALILGWLFRRPVNVGVFGPNPYDEHWRRAHWTHMLEAPLAKWVLRRAQGIQADGQLTARRLTEVGLGHVRVKPMVPSNLADLLAIQRPTLRQNEVPRLLYVGRFASQKNLDLLVDVCGRLAARGTPFELTMVGTGPEAERVRGSIERVGLSRWISLVGPVSRDRIGKVFAEADVVVLTSHYEGYPRVFMEAAAAALPIVATAVSGADEGVLDGVTGYIVPVGDAEAFTERLVQILSDPLLRGRMGEAARRHVRTRLDPAESARLQVSIWRELVTSNHPV